MTTRQFTQTISLLNSAGNNLAATLDCEAQYWQENGISLRNCIIALRCDQCQVNGEGRDYFDAFCRIREALEPHGFKPLCYGASRNVFPSGMGRDMGDGLKAYKMSMGKSATELVEIFAEGAGEEPVDVATQQEFRNAWVRSLGHRPAK